MGRGRSFCPLRTAGERSSLGSVAALGRALQAGLLRAGGAAVACGPVLSASSSEHGRALGGAVKGRKGHPVRREPPSAVGEQKANAAREMRVWASHHQVRAALLVLTLECAPESLEERVKG